MSCWLKARAATGRTRERGENRPSTGVKCPGELFPAGTSCLANCGDVIPQWEPCRRLRTAARQRILPRIPPNPPNADGRAEKRFPCAPVRGWTRRALARAFGGFAPRADSRLRGAGQADAGSGVTAVV